MKNTRKILTLLLALAVCFACSAVFAFAAEAAPSADQVAYDAALAEHKKVLEYYEAGYYLNADFGDAENLDDAFADASDEFSFTPGGAFTAEFADGAAHLSAVNPSYFDFVPENAESFGIKARIKLAAGSAFELYLHSSKRGSIGDYLRLFSVSEGNISHKLDCTGGAPKYLSQSSAVAADTYFDLDFFITKNSSEDVVVLTVTPDGGTAETLTYSFDNTVTDFLNGKFDFGSFYISAEEVTLSTLQVYKGSFVRDLDNSNNIEIIANAIAGMKADYDLYNTKVASHAYEIYEIVAALAVTHGYDASSLADTELVNAVEAFSQAAVNAVAPSYASSYSQGVAAINAEAAYYDRLDHLSSIAVYSDFLNSLKSSNYSDVEGIDYAKIDADVAKVEAEAAALVKAKEDTIIGVAAAVQIPDVYLATYADYRAVYDTLRAHAICATYYDEELSAQTVNLASKVANVVLSEYPVLDAKATAFVQNVPVAGDTSLSFAERYAAYVIAKENQFSDTTYNEFLVGTTLEEIISVYEAAEAELGVISAYAEEFLSKIDDAAKSPSYSVKNVALAEAAAYIDSVELEYPGVAEAIELYEVLLKDVSDRINATKSYIQAVIDVQNATTVADKKVAIEIAKGLAELGSDVSVEVDGFDITVTEANMILSNEESAILLAETKVANYIAAASALEGITDIKELRLAIARATALKAVADSTAEGVFEADMALDAAIIDYNARIKAANGVSNEVNNVALSALASTVPTVRVAEVVAIIKKFYEE